MHQQCSIFTHSRPELGNLAAKTDRGEIVIPKSIKDKFLKRIGSRPEDTKTCWFWPGAINAGGHGYIRVRTSKGENKKSRIYYAHRIAYEIFHEDELPDDIDIEVVHTCPHNHCCNPEHLIKVDRHNARRLQADHGLVNSIGRPLLTPDQVVGIRADYASGLSIQDLVNKYHVEIGPGQTMQYLSVSEMGKICRFDRWAGGRK
jgi:hypothetical protein